MCSSSGAKPMAPEKATQHMKKSLNPDDNGENTLAVSWIFFFSLSSCLFAFPFMSSFPLISSFPFMSSMLFYKLCYLIIGHRRIGEGES